MLERYLERSPRKKCCYPSRNMRDTHHIFTYSPSRWLVQLFKRWRASEILGAPPSQHATDTTTLPHTTTHYHTTTLPHYAIMLVLIRAPTPSTSKYAGCAIYVCSGRIEQLSWMLYGDQTWRWIVALAIAVLTLVIFVVAGTLRRKRGKGSNSCSRIFYLCCHKFLARESSLPSRSFVIVV